MSPCAVNNGTVDITCILNAANNAMADKFAYTAQIGIFEIIAGVIGFLGILFGLERIGLIFDSNNQQKLFDKMITGGEGDDKWHHPDTNLLRQTITELNAATKLYRRLSVYFIFAGVIALIGYSLYLMHDFESFRLWAAAAVFAAVLTPTMFLLSRVHYYRIRFDKLVAQSPYNAES